MRTRPCETVCGGARSGSSYFGYHGAPLDRCTPCTSWSPAGATHMAPARRSTRRCGIPRIGVMTLSRPRPLLRPTSQLERDHKKVTEL